MHLKCIQVPRRSIFVCDLLACAILVDDVRNSKYSYKELKRGHSPRILGLICKIVAVGAPTKGCGCGGSRLRLDPAISTYDGLVPYEVGIKYPSVGAVITRLDSPASSLEASSAGCSKGFSGSGVVGGFKENERLGMFSWYEDSSGTFDRATEP